MVDHALEDGLSFLQVLPDYKQHEYQRQRQPDDDAEQEGGNGFKHRPNPPT